MRAPLIVTLIVAYAVATTSFETEPISAYATGDESAHRRMKSKGRNHNTSPVDDLNKKAGSSSVTEISPTIESTPLENVGTASADPYLPQHPLYATSADIYHPTSSSSKGKGGGKKQSSSSKGGKKQSPEHLIKKRSKSNKKTKSRSKIGSKANKSRGKGKGGGGSGIPTAPPVPTSTPPTPIAPTSSPGTPTQAPTTRPPTGNPLGCTSALARTIRQSIPEVITQNPNACCTFSGPTAVIVTHGQKDDRTMSDFEPFWDNLYQEIDQITSFTDVCFVMTGIDQSVTTSKTISDILAETSVLVAQESSVPAVMVTDPTSDVALVQTIRAIYDTPTLSSIGVFNSGFDNLVIESILSGQPKLPFVGYESDEEYGVKAAEVTLELLDGLEAIPLCYNARLGQVDFIGRRCSAYYQALTETPPFSLQGVACSSETTPDEMISQIITVGANAVFAHIDCCAALGIAATAIREAGGVLYTGCMDDNTSLGGINFVTSPASSLQAYTVATWVILPVLQDIAGRDGRGEHFFPGLSSFINTAIFNTIIV